MPVKKQTKNRPKVTSTRSLKTKPKLNKRIAILLALIVAGVGAYLLFFASAATSNCQPEDGIPICDVDMVGGGSDTVLSVTGEAATLGSKGWGVYYGTNFRAPTSAHKGSVPITRVYNEAVTLHDWVTDTQKSAKEAKYGALKNEGVAFFAWKTQVTGTVPVYRLSRGGTATQNIYSTDKAWVDKILAQDANNPDGWKKESTSPFIAFYAYPPNYGVANIVNPYDCSILENFTSDRCKTARESLATAVSSGAIPAGTSCPTTYDAYKKAPFPSQFSAECQKKWNDYAQDCTKQENFLSDNCKGPRETLAREMQRIEAERAAAEAARAVARNSSQSSGGSRTSGSSSGRGSRTIANNNPGAIDCSRIEYYSTAACKTQREQLAAYIYYQNLPQTNRGWVPAKLGTCTIRWKMEQFWNVFGSTTGSKTFRNVTRTECTRIYYREKRNTLDGMNRRHYGYTHIWIANR